LRRLRLVKWHFWYQLAIDRQTAHAATRPPCRMSPPDDTYQKSLVESQTAATDKSCLAAIRRKQRTMRTPTNQQTAYSSVPLGRPYTRAKAVADYLTERGIPRTAIDQPDGKGRRQPRGFTDPQTAVIVERHNATDDQRARNPRRDSRVRDRGARSWTLTYRATSLLAPPERVPERRPRAASCPAPVSAPNPTRR
jgi:hypothetical protein